MNPVIFQIIFMFLINLNLSNNNIYYVDAINGNDKNGGKSPDNAWRTITKVNTYDFHAGDKILFKKGQIWKGMLMPNNSGSSSKLIIYSSYGDGEKPILTTKQQIPGSEKSNFWEKLNDSIYYGKISIYIDRMWINNIEFDKAKTISEINFKNRWHYDRKNKRIFIFFEDNNPEHNYVEIAGGLDNEYHTIKILDKDYIMFDGLKVQGGYTASIGLAGADNIIIKNCEIGKYSQGRGIIGNQLGLKSTDNTSDSVIIQNNIIDSGWEIFANYNRSGMDGVSVQNGANYWIIEKNKFKNWDHSAVQIYGYKASANYNKIFQNEVTAPDIAFSRAFESVGTDKKKCSYNEFYRNRVSHTTARSQFGGTNNKIYYNIFEHMKNSTVPYGNKKTAQPVVLAAVAGPSENNLVANNTIYDADREGIWDYGNNNFVVNNLIINAGKTIRGISLRISKNVKSGNWINNLIYFSNKQDKFLVDFREKKLTLEQFQIIEDKVNETKNGNIRFNGELEYLIQNIEDKDYIPAKGSPIIDAGNELGFKEDFYGNPIINKPDIGAVEYQQK